MVNHEDEWESLEALMEARADIAIQRACVGFGIDFEEALRLIRNADGLNNEQAVQRNIILAAVDNIADFAVAEEYQMADDMAELMEMLDDEGEDEMDEEGWFDFYFPIFSKFHDRYMRTENVDIEYAMIIAAYLQR